MQKEKKDSSTIITFRMLQTLPSVDMLIFETISGAFANIRFTLWIKLFFLTSPRPPHSLPPSRSSTGIENQLIFESSFIYFDWILIQPLALSTTLSSPFLFPFCFHFTSLSSFPHSHFRLLFCLFSGKLLEIVRFFKLNRYDVINSPFNSTIRQNSNSIIDSCSRHSIWTNSATRRYRFVASPFFESLPSPQLWLVSKKNFNKNYVLTSRETF